MSIQLRPVSLLITLLQNILVGIATEFEFRLTTAGREKTICFLSIRLWCDMVVISASVCLVFKLQ